MRNGRDGGGYASYTRDKDSITTGEVGRDDSTYNEEVYITHSRKQAANFTREREARERQQAREEIFAKQVFSVFSHPDGYEVFRQMKEYRKANVNIETGTTSFSGFSFSGDLNEDAVSRLTQDILKLYGNSPLMSCPEWDYVKGAIEKQYKKGEEHSRSNQDGELIFKDNNVEIPA